MKERVGIIGFGNMGSAIAERLRLKYEVVVFEKDQGKISVLAGGIKAAGSIRDLLEGTTTVILAVKPQDFPALLKGFSHYLKEKLIISIAAGITTGYIEKIAGNIKVIRVMPNIGVRIGESVTCLCKGSFATDDDLDLAKELFYYLGVTEEIKEEMMDAATAIAGSGPAYIFDFIETNAINPQDIPGHTRHDLMRRLERAAQSLGFSSEEAAFLAVNTTNASFKLMATINITPAELKKQVSSKGGTTEAALKVLKNGGSWGEAAQAALKRAGELAGKE